MNLQRINENGLQGMFVFKVQLHHTLSLKPDLLFFPLLYFCSCSIKYLRNPVWYLVTWLITIIFTDAQCMQKLHTRHTKKTCMHKHIHMHLDLHLAEQTSHVVQLRSEFSCTKHYHWQPKGLWKLSLADPSSVWFSCCKRSNIDTAAQHENIPKLNSHSVTASFLKWMWSPEKVGVSE